MKKSVDYSATQMINNKYRSWLTITIVILGFIVIIALAIIIIVLTTPLERPESTKWIFNAIIPLIASWIGTVIAFYFGRDNFESATRQALALTREYLEDINVNNIMIDVKTIVYRKVDPADDGKSSLTSIINLYKDIDKDRIPVFSTSLIPRFIIHRSTMIDYINAKQNTQADLSLKDIITDNPNKYSFEAEGGFVVVSKTATVEEAFNKMNNVKDCKDVFITDSGKETAEVIGWLTNTLINRFLTTR